MTYDDLYEAAREHRRSVAGQTVAVYSATISDDSDLDDRDFKNPLMCVFDDTELEHGDITCHNRGGHKLIDTHYSGVKALPGQLPDGEHVSWVYGPTFHLDGRVDPPPFKVVTPPSECFIG